MSSISLSGIKQSCFFFYYCIWKIQFWQTLAVARPAVTSWFFFFFLSPPEACKDSGLIFPSRFGSNLFKNWSVPSSVVTWDHNENAIVEIGRLDGWDFRVGYKSHLSSHWRCCFYPKGSMFVGGCRLCFLIMYNNTRGSLWKQHMHYFFPFLHSNIKILVILYWRLVIAPFKWGVSWTSVCARHSQNSTAWRKCCGKHSFVLLQERAERSNARARNGSLGRDNCFACIRSSIRPSCQQTGWDQVP